MADLNSVIIEGIIDSISELKTDSEKSVDYVEIILDSVVLKKHNYIKCYVSGRNTEKILRTRKNDKLRIVGKLFNKENNLFVYGEYLEITKRGEN